MSLYAISKVKDHHGEMLCLFGAVSSLGVKPVSDGEACVLRLRGICIWDTWWDHLDNSTSAGRYNFEREAAHKFAEFYQQPLHSHCAFHDDIMFNS